MSRADEFNSRAVRTNVKVYFQGKQEKMQLKLKAASLVKVLRASYFTCECECKCSALLTHSSRKAGAEVKAEGTDGS